MNNLVHIISFTDQRILILCFQFIERTRVSVKNSESGSDVSRINPGDWGKIGPGWLVQSLENRGVSPGGRGRIHQFLWRRSRAVSNANKGTRRQEAIRNRIEPNKVVRASFEPGRIAVTQRVMVATVHQHGVYDSGGPAAAESAKRKTAKAGTK